MAELSIILKRLREKKSLTIVELSKISGVGQGTIGDIERGKIKKGSIKTLEKLSKGMNLTETERNELFSVMVPKDIGAKIITPEYKNLNSKGRMQLKDILEETTLLFNDETVAEEDKKKILEEITDAFYDAKQKNKRK